MLVNSKRAKVVYETRKHEAFAYVDFKKVDGFGFMVERATSREWICFDCLNEDDEIYEVYQLEEEEVIKETPKDERAVCHQCGEGLVTTIDNPNLVPRFCFDMPDRVGGAA